MAGSGMQGEQVAAAEPAAVAGVPASPLASAPPKATPPGEPGSKRPLEAGEDLEAAAPNKRIRGGAGSSSGSGGADSGGPASGVRRHVVDLEAAYSEDKGSRLTMEDVAVIQLEEPGTAEQPRRCRVAFCSIFDGHGGAAVARYAAEHLHRCVLAAGLEAAAAAAPAAAGGSSIGNGTGSSLPGPPGFSSNSSVGGAAAGSGATQGAAVPAGGGSSLGPVAPAGSAEAGHGGSAVSAKQCRAAIAAGFKALDQQVLERCAAEGWSDGCTAVAAWVVEETVLVANVGDAKAVLARRPPSGGEGTSTGAAQQQPDEQKQQGQQQQQQQQPPQGQQPMPRSHEQQPPTQQQEQPAQQAQQAAKQLKGVTLTREHKAIFPQERQRIERAGGFVSADGRLGGRIEVSRALGDRAFKRQGMTAVPDIQAFQLSERDEFLLLGCDGFWGVFNPQDAVQFAARELWERGHGVKQACNRLLHEAVRERGCRDNCTVLLLRFVRRHESCT